MLKDMFYMYLDRSDFFIELTLQHLSISFISIFISSSIGIFLGILISYYKKYASLAMSSVNFIYTIPSISLLGFLIPLSGIGNTSAIIALSIYGLLPIIRSTYTGINGIDPFIIESAKGMGSTNFQILYKVKIPLASTVILSGFRNAVVMTIALCGISSFIGAGGLGVAIYRGITTNNTTLTLCGSLLIAILASCTDLLIGFFENLLKKKWRLS